MNPCQPPSPAPNLSGTSPDAQNRSTCATPLTLRLRNVGDVIPFKNRKRAIYSERRKQTFLITEPDVKRQMNAITDSFVAILDSALRTAGGATWTDAQRRSWIVSCLPDDDCWTCIPDQRQTGEVVPMGEEGCDITLERIDAHQLLLDASIGGK